MSDNLCSDVQTKLIDYYFAELSPEEQAICANHVHDCEHCFAELQALKTDLEWHSDPINIGQQPGLQLDDQQAADLVFRKIGGQRAVKPNPRVSMLVGVAAGVLLALAGFYLHSSLSPQDQGPAVLTVIEDFDGRLAAANHLH